MSVMWGIYGRAHLKGVENEVCFCLTVTEF